MLVQHVYIYISCLLYIHVTLVHASAARARGVLIVKKLNKYILKFLVFNLFWADNIL